MTSKIGLSEGAVWRIFTAMDRPPAVWVADFPRPGRIHAGTADVGAVVASEIAGAHNLRGRIVTVVDMRAQLGLLKNDDGNRC